MQHVSGCHVSSALSKLTSLSPAKRSAGIITLVNLQQLIASKWSLPRDRPMNTILLRTLQPPSDRGALRASHSQELCISHVHTIYLAIPQVHQQKPNHLDH